MRSGFARVLLRPSCAELDASEVDSIQAFCLASRRKFPWVEERWRTCSSISHEIAEPRFHVRCCSHLHAQEIKNQIDT